MPNPPVSVTVPVSQAIERTEQLLFRPFSLDRWFILGFCAWLATLGDSSGFNFNFRFGRHKGEENLCELFARVREYVLENLQWIVPLAIVLVVFLVAIGIAMLWVRSRGQFMYLYCVALNKAEVAAPWRRFAAAGNSLFWFRLVLGFIGAAVALPLVVLIAVPVVRMISAGEPDVRNILAATLAGGLWLIGCIAFGVVAKLTTDFVVPVMFLRGRPCVEAWKELLGLIAGHVTDFLVYLLFQIVLGLAAGVIVVAVVVATCCVAGCLMAIPYIGTVVLLPVLTFKRSYSLHYLAQYGADYDVFPPANLPVAPAG